MKKYAFFVMLVLGLVAVNGQAQAVPPTIDGVVAAGEWDNNVAYQSYLHVVDGADVTVVSPGQDSFDIDKITLLQKITPPFPGAGPYPSDDGIYLLIETVGTATLNPLIDTTTNPDSPGSLPFFTLQADFNGDNLIDLEFKLNAGGLSWIRPSAFLGAPVFAEQPCTGNGEVCTSGLGGNFIEIFFPTTTGGAPHIPLPQDTFQGWVRSQDGINLGDDVVFGTFPVVPEPSTLFMFGSAILGLFGARFRK